MGIACFFALLTCMFFEVGLMTSGPAHACASSIFDRDQYMYAQHVVWILQNSVERDQRVGDGRKGEAEDALPFTYSTSFQTSPLHHTSP